MNSAACPAHPLPIFFACCTLPQQTPLIIDALEWPHHHWILPSGRIINFITATLTYLLYCSARCGTSRGVDSLETFEYYYTVHILDLSVCLYVSCVRGSTVLPGHACVQTVVVGIGFYSISHYHTFFAFISANILISEQFRNTFPT